MMHGMKPMTVMNDMQNAAMKEMNSAGNTMEQFSPVHGRTVDLMNLSPVSVGVATPTAYTASSVSPAVESNLGYGHSFLKPQPVQTIPALPVAVISQHQPHSLVHPWLMPHLMPHIMPHIMPQLVSNLMPSIPSFIPHRIEPHTISEMPQNEMKQPPMPPMQPMPQYSYHSPDTALICQPVRNQRIDSSYDYIYKPDMAMDKSMNISESAKRMSNSIDEENKMKEHLRKVNEIKEEITQLNRAAQRIVDQQERLTEMQQKQQQHWGSSSMSSSMQNMNRPISYMGGGYYSQPSMPWGYSRANILSYPNSNEDIDFFMNLLKAGKSIGTISNTLQPILNTAGEVLNGVPGTSKSAKETTETSNMSARAENPKAISPPSPPQLPKTPTATA